MANNIPEAEHEYVGYYWMSDKTIPSVIGDKDDLPTEKMPVELKNCLSNPESNPFVIEAQLYDQEHNLSFGIKFVDGEYVITECKIPEEVAPDTLTIKEYAANRMDNRILLFHQYWKEESDAFCEGFKVLQAAAMAFVGFKKTTEKDKKNE